MATLEQIAAQYELEGKLVQAILGFDPRWLDPKFNDQENSDYDLLRATEEALGDLMLSFQEKYQEIHPEWRPPELCPCGWPTCAGDCEEMQS